MKFTLPILSILLPVVFTGCTSTTSLGYGSERKQLLITSQERVEAHADKKSKNLIKADNNPILRVSELRAVRIMNELIPYANSYTPDRLIDWDIAFVNSRKTMIGAMGNGTIVVSTPFLGSKALSDDALAMILAHEMAHIIRQHHREKSSINHIVRPALLGAAVITTGGVAIAAATTSDLMSGFSRTLEREADLLGLEISSKAGFNPYKAIKFFEDYEKTFKDNHPIASRIPSFLSTHPKLSKRKKYSEEFINDELNTALSSNYSVEKNPANLIKVHEKMVNLPVYKMTVIKPLAN